ncbi:hypothetical protein [Ensifer adhaerens]|uniref:hypothetical protein n=1 Tax=Ensifer adhaerens TaxID=106592 RepID=UPI001319BE29|nr:hypothetical protein [Ensifer adhaerens]
MKQIESSELGHLSHIDTSVLDGRNVLLMPVWDGQSWSQWIPTGDKKLMKISVVDVGHAAYLAEFPADPSDVFFGFIDFIWQRASWPQLVPLFSSICDDFHLMATSVAKLEHLHASRESIDRLLISSFVKTELEYLITVARSVFDLLQEAVARFWNDKITLLDAEMETKRKRHKLPPTFSKVVLNGDTSRTAKEIADRYGLPPGVAEMYEKHAPFFKALRASRDGIIHGGTTIDTIFATEKGFCVDPKSRHYGDYPWKEEHYYNSAIVSLSPWVARTVFQTMEACSDVMFSLAEVISFPGEIAPGYKVYMRDPSNKALLRLLDVANGS